MKAIYYTQDGRLQLEITAEDVKTLFAQLACAQEVFDTEHECGRCHQKGFRYQFRLVEDFDFYELVCLNPECRARFEFGQLKKPKGALYPKRKDEDGKWLLHGGWSKYVKPGTQDHQPAPAPVAASSKGSARIPTFADRDEAEEAMQKGTSPIRVGGVVYQLSDDGTQYQIAKGIR